MKIEKKIFALVCALAIALTLCACGSTEYFEWPTSGMAELLPEPSTTEGHLHESSTIFEVTLENTTEEDFQEYLNACREMGYTIDETDLGSDSYMAYNHSGYKLYTYFSSKNEIHVQLVAPTFYDAGSTFHWPTMGPATLIPKPISHVGRIETDTSTTFEVYVGETTIDEYNDYVNQCIEAGFDQNYSKSDYSFRAWNTEDYRLEVEYKSGNIIYISIKDIRSSTREDESETEETTTEDSVSPEVSEEVTVSPVSESPEETTNTTNDDNETNIDNTSTAEDSESDVLTADNCPEFAEVLSCGDYSNQLYADFYEKYKGKKIEFDGNIVLVENDDYNGYYDVMICPGDYQENVAYGPLFEFDGASPSAFEEGNNSMELPSYVKVGTNVHVVATLSRYNDFAGVCYLYPTSVTER